MSETSEISLAFKELEGLKRKHSIHPDCSLSTDLYKYTLKIYELGVEMACRKSQENFLTPFISTEN